jgi:hypothetical protein
VIPLDDEPSSLDAVALDPDRLEGLTLGLGIP